MIDRHPLTRRAVFQGLGAMVALPWLESLATADERLQPQPASVSGVSTSPSHEQLHY